MEILDISALVNTIGFAAGTSLYAMLLVMVLRGPASAVRVLSASIDVPTFRLPADQLPLATGLLGLVWNLTELFVYISRDLGGREPATELVAVAFTALGFLPAVVVHSATGAARTRAAVWVRAAAYALSATGAVLQVAAAVTGTQALSDAGLWLLTVGFLVVIAALFGVTRQSPYPRRAVWVAALSVFAVSALHLTHHTGNESWTVELVGHHASIPLAVAILYQHYRFALADIFLKRALSLVLLILVAFGLYVGVGVWLLEMRGPAGRLEPLAAGATLVLWVLTALCYPALRAAASWFVDTVILRRVDYAKLRADVARTIAPIEDPVDVLETACRALGPALDARAVAWRVAERSAAAPSLVTAWLESSRLVHPAGGESERGDVLVTVTVPTAEAPQYAIDIGELEGGRRLLSDDVAMLEAISNLVARRIDAVRVSHERYVHDVREQEISKLAAEAELRALRAQINPHFLFNALTTIGYLIQTAPERAVDTLLQLTGLLRAVLKRSGGEMSTVGEELDLVQAYLAIERARFEERLSVGIGVPDDVRGVRLPTLLLQPIVENAVKHGIAPARDGGHVQIDAVLEGGDGGAAAVLHLTVSDTGRGASPEALDEGLSRGIGIASIQRRLTGMFGPSGRIAIASAPGEGTTVDVWLPATGDVRAAERGEPAATASER